MLEPIPTFLGQRWDHTARVARSHRRHVERKTTLYTLNHSNGAHLWTVGGVSEPEENRARDLPAFQAFDGLSAATPEVSICIKQGK